MKSICNKLLILLLACAMPTLSNAVENATGDQKASPTAPQAVLTTTPKTVAAPGMKLEVQPALNAAPTVTTPNSAATPLAAIDAKPQPAIQIGYVDLVQISTESETGKAGQAKLTAKKDKLQNQIESKRKQLDKQKAAIEAKLPTLTQQQRESKAKEFQKKVAEFQKFLQKADSELQELQQELSRTLFEKIEQAAAEYAKSKGLALVTVKRDLVYIAGNVVTQDVTEGVVKLINEKDSQKK